MIKSSAAVLRVSAVARAARVALRALDLVEAIVRDPFTGIGKPEPLK